MSIYFSVVLVTNKTPTHPAQDLEKNLTTDDYEKWLWLSYDVPFWTWEKESKEFHNVSDLRVRQ